MSQAAFRSAWGTVNSPNVTVKFQGVRTAGPVGTPRLSGDSDRDCDVDIFDYNAVVTKFR
jgi:hypothetical protein